MTSRQKNIPSIGRVNTVLIHGYGNNSRGVLSTIIAKVCGQNASDNIRLTSPASFDEKALHHISEVILLSAPEILKVSKLL